MDLGLAGVISGAGNAAKDSLAQTQKYMIDDALQTSRQDMENLRQDKLLATTRALQSEKISADDRRSDKELDVKTKLHGDELLSRDTLSRRETDARVSEGDLDRNSRKGIAADANRTHLTIAREHNSVLRDLEKIKISLSTKSTNAAEMNAIGNVLGDKRRELTTLKRELLSIATDPMKSDALKNPPPAIKMLLDEIEASKDEVDRLQAQFNIRGGVAPAEKKADPEPWTLPGITSSPAKSAPTERGLVQAPLPSPEIQSQMEAAEELRRRAR